MDFENEALEEPSFEEETEENESIPDEISIPKVDDIIADENDDDEIFIESNSTDFMDSVSTNESNEVSNDVADLDETTDSEELEEIADDIVQDEVISEEVTTEDEISETQEENPFIDDLLSEDPSVKEGLSDENVNYLTEETSENDDTIEESFEMAEPEVIDEPIVEEEIETSVEEPIIETEEITETETEDDNSEDDDGDLPASIKNDVKSVLLCMDQLLESLPEDKIMEFAKSEQFATYKKLFKDLGLTE